MHEVIYFPHSCYPVTPQDGAKVQSLHKLTCNHVIHVWTSSIDLVPWSVSINSSCEVLLVLSH